MKPSEGEQEISSRWREHDPEWDYSLQPASLDEFIGQEAICNRLEIVTCAAKMRKEPLGHSLLVGPPGLGKTTIAQLLARKMEGQITITSGPVIEKAGDLAGIITHLERGDLLFIDEIHRLKKPIEEYLYPAMERFSLDLLIDSGPNARSVQIPIRPFTLIGATTKMGLLSSPMRSRFAHTFRLEYYSVEELVEVISRSSRLLQLKIDQKAAREISLRARGTPRIANHLLRWVRDYAQAHHLSCLSHSVAIKALDMSSVDPLGLEGLDQKMLLVLIRDYRGGPVGISALAAVLGEDKETLEEVYEPYLVSRGLIRRTPRGREATTFAFRHLEKIKLLSPS